MLSPARGRMMGTTVVMTPWEGRGANYQQRDGMRLPLAGEGAWLGPEGRKAYWRGTNITLSHGVRPLTLRGHPAPR